MQITKEIVDKLMSLLDFGLVKGAGNGMTDNTFCVEQAVSIAIGEPLNDNPISCVSEVVAVCKRNLNDCNWSSNTARAEGMRKLAIAQLGSNVLDSHEFSQRLILNSAKRLLTYVIQKYYDNTKNEKLLEWKLKFESLTKIDPDLWSEFYDYYNYNCFNGDYFNNYYNYFNDYNHFYDCCYYNHFNSCYHYNYFGDEYLLLVADVILQTLIELKSPGCEWLHLAEERNKVNV